MSENSESMTEGQKSAQEDRFQPPFILVNDSTGKKKLVVITSPARGVHIDALRMASNEVVSSCYFKDCKISGRVPGIEMTKEHFDACPAWCSCTRSQAFETIQRMAAEKRGGEFVCPTRSKRLHVKDAARAEELTASGASCFICRLPAHECDFSVVI